jgi:exodeoxyribonuclease VII large subunit
VQILAVSELSRYLRDVFDSDHRLQALWVEGEVSNFKRSPAGHCYFTLKDAGSMLRCAWFCNSIPARARIPRDGDHVVAHGRVSVYEQRGEYQLYVNVVQPAGAGALSLQLEELRARLEREGLFDEARKRRIPRFPRRIGVVTSPVGAVFRDILNVVARRYRGVEIVLAPTLVQGEGAAPQVAGAIEALNLFAEPDVVVVARGGGSLEDLWAFNEEIVARAIYASRAPVVSGIGHEADWTIADLVADLRAPTPSAAAELIVPDAREHAVQLTRTADRLTSLVLGHVEEARLRVDRLEGRLERLSPQLLIAARRQALDDLAERSRTSLRHRLELRRAELVGRSQQLAALSPLSILARGYSITRLRSTGRLVRRPEDVYPGAAIDVQVAEGRLGAVVDGTGWTQAPIPLDGVERGARDA